MRSPAVDNLLFDWPEERRLTAEVLREIIFAQVKGVQEQMKWGCPFYSKDGMLCYINFDRKLKKVVLALVEGFLMEDKYHQLIGDTQNIKKLVFESPDTINERQIAYYLKQGMQINQAKTRNFVSIHKKRR
ncbi:MAG: DUF1801 domain-containing protein [Cyclobacteriaceae bacterium]|jgi:hypothetical protein|nr:DUF1801 domain-containing protein [Cyclobacteriaceae bacterium]